MSDTNVKVTLTADGSQVRNELRLIDQEAAKLGRGQSNGGRVERDDQTGASQRANSNDPDQEELSRELTLIRKELQRLNEGGGLSSGSGKGGGGGKDPSQGGGFDFSSVLKNLGGGNSSSILASLGKAAAGLTAATLAIKGIKKLYNSASEGYQSNAEGESLAYDVYGSSTNFTDYYDAKKYGYGLGKDYGYSYDESMSANKTYMSSGGGWTDEETNATNMTNILRTAHSTGIDTATMSSAAGSAAAMGTDPTKFTTLLANSIQEAEMTGREGEQLDVLNNIADMLHETNVTVSENQIADTLAVYSALVNGNENLKGEAGYEAVETVNDAYTSGNTALMRALGYGTEYTGQEGMLEVYRKMAEGATTENLDDTMDYLVNTLGITDKNQLEYMLGSMWGMNNPSGVKTLDEYMNNYYDYDEASGTWDRHQNDEDKGSTLLDEESAEEYNAARDENYNNADVSTTEKYENELKDTKEDMSEGIFSGIKNWFKDQFNSMSDGEQEFAQVMNAALPAAGVGILGKAGSLIYQSGQSAVVDAAANYTVDWAAMGAEVTSEATAAATEAAAETATAAAAETAAEAATAAAAETAAETAAGAATEAATAAATEAGAAAATEAGATAAGGALSTIAEIAGPLAILAQGFLIGTDIDDDGNVKLTYGDVGKSVFVQAGEEIAQQSSDAETNYGSIWAADWNPLNGLWRKNGTITEQKMNGTYDWSDEEVDVVDANGNVTGTTTVGEAEENNHKVYNNWTVDNADDIDAFQQAIKEHTDSSGNVDLSFMEGVDMETANMLLKSVFGEDVFSSGKLKSQQYMLGTGQTMADVKWGDSESEWYEGQLDGSDLLSDANSIADLESSNEDLNDTLSELNETTDELKQYLQDKYGLSSSAADMYMDTNSSDIDTKSDFNLLNPSTWFNHWGRGHAVGNDYVPYDNYAALLHKGEMVLTAADADDYRSGKTSSSANGTTDINLNINLGGSINGMTSENQQQIVAAIVSQIGQSDFNSMLSTSFKRVQNY